MLTVGGFSRRDVNPELTRRGSVAFPLDRVRKAQFAQHGRSVYNHF